MGEGYGAGLLSGSPPLPTGFFFFFFFFFGCRWVFLDAPRLSVVAVSRGYFSLGRKASHCGGFSCFGSWALQQCLSSCGAQAELHVACEIFTDQG